MISNRRIVVLADGTLAESPHPREAFLLVGVNGTLDDAEAARYGLAQDADGRLLLPGEKRPEPAVKAVHAPAATKHIAAPAADKAVSGLTINRRKRGDD
jgi:hypothetical protein